MSDNSNNSLGDDSLPNRSKEDDDLSELLDNSLQDFGKSDLQSAPADENGDIAAELLAATSSNEINPELAKKAAKDFKSMLEQLTEVQKIVVDNMKTKLASQQNGQTDTVDDSVVNNNGTVNGSSLLSDENDACPAASTDQQGQEELAFAQTLMENMKCFVEKAAELEGTENPEEFLNIMQELTNDEDYEQNFIPFMQGLMSSLLSKDMLYGSLKEMSEKYPVWIEENQSKLDQETLARYKSQLKLIEDACVEYEHETESETDEQKAQRYERLVVIMQKMQACGQPPDELIGKMPPGWSYDSSSGVPQVVDTEKAAESCSIM